MTTVETADRRIAAAKGHTGRDAEYFPAFDYIRIFLAAAVATSHVTTSSFDFGNFAVQIFFALSGWLIGGILLKTKPSDLPRFYFNRAARIWVPYFVANVLLAGAYIATFPITQKWIELTFYKLTFVFNFFGITQPVRIAWNGNHFWSICAEEQFYLIAPLLIVAFKFGRSPWTWLALFTAVMTTWTWNFFASISLGVLAAIMRERVGDWHRPAPVATGIAVTAILILCAMIGEVLPYRIGSPVCAILIILLFARPGKQTPLSDFLGGVSYPMYLNHWIGISLATFIFKRIGLPHEVSYQAFSVAVSFLIAAILYVLVDRVLRRRRSELYTPSRGKAVAIIGYGLVLSGAAVGLALLGQWGK